MKSSSAQVPIVFLNAKGWGILGMGDPGKGETRTLPEEPGIEITTYQPARKEHIEQQFFEISEDGRKLKITPGEVEYVRTVREFKAGGRPFAYFVETEGYETADLVLSPKVPPQPRKDSPPPGVQYGGVRGCVLTGLGLTYLDADGDGHFEALRYSDISHRKLTPGALGLDVWPLLPEWFVPVPDWVQRMYPKLRLVDPYEAKNSRSAMPK